MGKSSTKEDRSTKRKSAEKTKIEKVKQSTDFKKEKSKKDKVKSEIKDKTTGNSNTPSGWNNWAAAEFDNDDRKQKFLRFMGVKPGATSNNKQGASPFASAITKEGAGQIHKELEKQFGAGIDQRRQGMRGGLGF
ncbi:hypothetical protein IW142_000835 [Coemansia sp. RSA 564]|nr:hypothetical protein IW142_000835 [Coemansia sp. RSA 564]KAJ2832577.1 hypothetical protein J3B01_004802 [Coemansia erecta]